MTSDRPHLASALLRTVAALAIALAPFALSVAPATAAPGTAAPAVPSTSLPTTVAATTSTADDVATDCQPASGVSCVAVMVLNADNDRVAGAEITLTGPDGFSATFTTTADAVPSVEVPAAGAYTATIDPATLPDDEPLPEGAPEEIEVTAQTGGTARAAFQVGAGAEAPAPTEEEETSSAPADAGQQPASDGEGVGAAPEGDASQAELTWGQVWQQIGSGLRFGLLLALASIGVNLVFGTTGLSNFAHGEQFALGAAAGYITINLMGMPIWLGGLITIAACSLTGLVQDAAIWRPLRRRNVPVMQLMIVSIGLSITLQYVIQMMIGAGTERILTRNPEPWTVLGITLSAASWISMAVAVVCIVAIAWFLTRTRIGQATRAVSDNSALAAATGIDPDKIIRIVWVMATGFAALAGLMWGISFGAINWQLGVQLLLLMFAAVVLGGLGTAFGALLGSIVIGLVVELSNLVIPSDLRYASALGILILVLLFRPQGILGRRERVG